MQRVIRARPPPAHWLPATRSHVFSAGDSTIQPHWTDVVCVGHWSDDAGQSPSFPLLPVHFMNARVSQRGQREMHQPHMCIQRLCSVVIRPTVRIKHTTCYGRQPGSWPAWPAKGCSLLRYCITTKDMKNRHHRSALPPDSNSALTPGLFALHSAHEE